MWTREIPSIDPVAAAARLRRLPGLAFLDSAMRHDPLGRHSIVAADPFARFRFRDGRATLDGELVPGGPFAALRACALAMQRSAPALPGSQQGPSAAKARVGRPPVWPCREAQRSGCACVPKDTHARELTRRGCLNEAQSAQ
jgi:hypothetical protein